MRSVPLLVASAIALSAASCLPGFAQTMPAQTVPAQPAAPVQPAPPEPAKSDAARPDQARAPAPAGPAPGGQPTCGAEATQQNLTGPARTVYVAECHKRRGDAPAAAGGGSVVSTTRLPDRQRVGRSRQECREIARTRHLWGLARHKFLQRCRYGTTRRTPPLNR